MKRLFIFFTVLLLLISCSREKVEKKSEKRLITVSVIVLKKEKISLEYRVKGFFETPKDVVLRPEVSGLVKEVFVKEGEFVKKGHPLLKVDDRELKAQLRELRAKLEEAKINYEYQKDLVNRRKKLLEKELIAREQYKAELSKLKALEKQIESLEASLKLVSIRLGKTTLRAPFEGYIAERYVSEGDYVTPQSQTFRLISLNPLYFTFKIPQEHVNYVTKGENVRVEVPQVGTVEGKVFYISPYADSTRQILVKAYVSNENNTLKPGMYGIAKIETKKVEAFRVPERAVVLSGNRKVVWVLKGEEVRAKEVSILKEEGGYLYVKGNLREGEKVVVDNAYALREGMKVRVR